MDFAVCHNSSHLTKTIFKIKGTAAIQFGTNITPMVYCKHTNKIGFLFSDSFADTKQQTFSAKLNKLALGLVKQHREWYRIPATIDLVA
ncbi:hypothetical protein [Stenoxybacter acetivorans]|uniref:hypothetical protein n=1 Tax=Stenoxybacter acetivorans TaxID=422441 RepID=UPI0012EC0C97|nr:hypothetical protein [Stenoxybacter acetivorans]